MTSVEITAINGTILLRVPLKYDSNNVYTGGPFLPIDGPWFIAVSFFLLLFLLYYLQLQVIYSSKPIDIMGNLSSYK